VVVEHQQDAGDDLNQEEEERQAAHAPGERETDAALAHGHRVQVQEHIAQHRHCARAPVARDAVAEDRVPDLRLANVVTESAENAHGSPECVEPQRCTASTKDSTANRTSALQRQMQRAHRQNHPAEHNHPARQLNADARGQENQDRTDHQTDRR
jgi:hypothetical protein